MLTLFKYNSLYYIAFFACSLAAALLLGPVIIPQLKKLKFGQAIREEGPKSHLSKSGTPTIGGLIFITAFLVPICFFLMHSYEVFYVLAGVLGFGMIGFLDDYIKVVRKHNLGLRAKQKIFLQLFMSLVMAILALKFGTTIRLPILGYALNLGFLFIPFMLFYFIAVDNAVNLTDGLDGLAASVTTVVMLFYAYFAYRQHMPQMVMLSLAMAGALMGYLKFNWHPAKVFMGDTGSLALGGMVAAMAVVLKMPLWVPIIGLIYVIEALSVVIQVGVYKKTKKRFFKMAPIHHHFELVGYTEKRIVVTFALVTLFTGVLGILVY
ncbi:phospho-N-acetylmuramoyl-pentapeptide-transferase [Fusibacter ferrireducens]|uniref:Phospho-N-acetylmuramoyl-pentapeptide-transferase n=1 Tax=Fusibacter ferrireducens TaxID=2785058 RepID=A0ABR9ZMA9_9FIRM|nr:phospho-N-acetylmuramoyl-pentapeptide-transferase [Fusibacter ferrireducens]MBF4691602.1 phospho-N-acetylmuramoyl-pentapeptide-transferase [Fusibacter ferrireducens]